MPLARALILTHALNLYLTVGGGREFLRSSFGCVVGKGFVSDDDALRRCLPVGVVRGDGLRGAHSHVLYHMRVGKRKLCGALQAQGVRIIDAAGGLSYAGLVQIQTDSGFGSICGMNQAAADVVCKQLGYGSGVASDSPCGSYGGSDLCGAPGSPVAMQSLTCTGAELAVGECEWSAPDATCSSHGSDSIVFCAGGAVGPQVENGLWCGGRTY